MPEPLKILVIEPFFEGSHRDWMEGLRQHSAHDIHFLTLPGKYWKWRMQAAAVSLAEAFSTRRKERFDLLVGSDMLNIPDFLSLTRPETARLPVLMYFHENQAAYPWSPRDRDRHRGTDEYFAMRNFLSALTADSVVFNSEYNRTSFLEGVEKILARAPDFHLNDALKKASARGRVLPLGLGLRELEVRAATVSVARRRRRPELPLIVWNHRWEYDKNPELFFALLRELLEQGLEFEVAVLGATPDVVPKCFEEARHLLGNRIVQWGFVSAPAEYAAWLAAGTVCPVVAHQEFFGMSVIEAASLGCLPVLPRRLSYPELFPPHAFPELFYRSKHELVEMLRERLQHSDPALTARVRIAAKRFDWNEMIAEYDQLFSHVARRIRI